MILSRSELVALLKSDDLKPFWDEVDKIRRSEVDSLMSSENPAYLKSLKAIDRIIQIPSVMQSNIATANRK